MGDLKEVCAYVGAVLDRDADLIENTVLARLEQGNQNVSAAYCWQDQWRLREVSDAGAVIEREGCEGCEVQCRSLTLSVRERVRTLAERGTFSVGTTFVEVCNELDSSFDAKAGSACEQLFYAFRDRTPSIKHDLDELKWSWKRTKNGAMIVDVTSPRRSIDGWPVSVRKTESFEPAEKLIFPRDTDPAVIAAALAQVERVKVERTRFLSSLPNVEGTWGGRPPLCIADPGSFKSTDVLARRVFAK